MTKTKEPVNHFRKNLQDDAREAFDCFVVDLTTEEIEDMLVGNPGRASGLPDLSNWSKYADFCKEMNP